MHENFVWKDGALSAHGQQKLGRRWVFRSVWDPAVYLVWWKFTLRSSAFPTSTSTPIRVHYAKSVTFAFSLCVEPLNSITIACCHDNTIMHFLQRGKGMSDTERSVAGSIMQSRWCESLETIWIMTAASLTCRVSEKTHLYSSHHFWFPRKGRRMLEFACHILTHAHRHQRAGLWTGSLSVVFITVLYSENAKLTKLTGMCFK